MGESKVRNFSRAVSTKCMPYEQLLGILFQPSPEYWPGYRRETTFTGVCLYCGQVQSILATSTESANQKATQGCSCFQAQQNKTVAEQNLRRARCLLAAEDKIDRLFGDGAEQCGKESVGEKSIEILNFTATLVYDKVIVKQTCNLTDTIRATISRTRTGNIAIERKDTESEKVEIS